VWNCRIYRAAKRDPSLIEGLSDSSNRGYDSAGVAIMNGQGVETRKEAGKISRLEAALATKPVDGNLGIAHTRWATHGVPNQCKRHRKSIAKNHMLSSTTESSKTPPRSRRSSKSSATISLLTPTRRSSLT